MTILGGRFWEGNKVVSEIWEDNTGRPVNQFDPRAVRVKYRVGDVITEEDKQRLTLEYYQPPPDQIHPV